MKYYVNDDMTKTIRRLQGDHMAKKAYFSTGIQIQKNAYKEDYAKRKAEETCTCLNLSGFCNRDCDRCAMDRAAKEAIREIRAGLRPIPDRVNRGDVTVSFVNVKGRRIRIEVC